MGGQVDTRIDLGRSCFGAVREMKTDPINVKSKWNGVVNP